MPDRIIIAFDETRAAASLRGTRFLIFDTSVSPRERGPLYEAGGEPLAPLPESSWEACRFLDAFIDLVGELGRELSSEVWWAMATSAKDPLNSTLFDELRVLWRVRSALETSVDLPVAIVGLPPSLAGVVRSFASASGCTVTVVGALATPMPSAWSERIRFLASTWRKMFIARRSFGCPDLGNEHGFLLRSWVYESSFQDDGLDDVYFGRLADLLAVRGEHVTVLAAILRDYTTVVERMRAHRGHVVYPQECFAHPLDPLRVVRRMMREVVRVPDEVRFDGLDVTDVVRCAIDRDLRSRATLNNLMQRHYVGGVLRRGSFHTFATTFEGYPWERIALLAVRRTAPEARTVGYLHSQFLPALTNLYVGPLERDVVPLPDIIVTSGRASADALVRVAGHDPDRVKVGCSLRWQSPPTETKRHDEGAPLTVLVVLGEFERALRVARMVVNAFSGVPDVQVVLRHHPANDVARFDAELAWEKDHIENVRTSPGGPLLVELEEADVVVYDASTVCLQAFAMGKSLVHVDLGDPYTFDPLYALDSLRHNVTDADMLREAVEELAAMGDDERAGYRALAARAVEKYVGSVSSHCVDLFLGCEESLSEVTG